MQKLIKYSFTGLLILFLIILKTGFVKAQNATDLRFSEILVLNDSNYVDDFGMRSAWIEIFNSAYNTVDIGGCYLTDDLSNPKKYWIPVGSPATRIPSRCYVVFWADNKPTRGIFHLNFDLFGDKTLALYNADGKTLIDKIDIPSNQQIDVTYGRPTNDSQEWVFLGKSTPGANNDYSKKASSGEKFVEFDPYGLGMTFIAMFVVFMSLTLLYIIYKNLGKFFVKKSLKSKVAKDQKSTSTDDEDEEMSGETNAAIAMALHLYQSELHDHENTVLTIQKVSRNYSPWSSKIYTLRKTPR